MTSYKVILTPDAVKDLIELCSYMADVLLVPETALEYIQKIRAEIRTLSHLPGRIKAVEEEPWHSRGLRRIIAENFFIYFRIDENSRNVYILSVIYAKSDQLKQLGNKIPARNWFINE